MANAHSYASNRAPRPPAIIATSSDHALDEFLPEETPPAPPVRHDPPLWRRIDERAPAVDLGAYEIQSIAPPPVRETRPHPRAARVAQSLIGALLVVTAVRAYQIYVPSHAATTENVSTPPAPDAIAAAATADTAQPSLVPASTPPLEPAAPPPPSVAAPQPLPAPPARPPATERAKTTTTVARGVVQDVRSTPHEPRVALPSRGPAQLNPEAAAAFWGSRGGRASQPSQASQPQPQPSGAQVPALGGAALPAAPQSPAPPPAASSTVLVKASVPVANPPAFIGPTAPVKITSTPAANEGTAPASVASPREVETALIESVLTQYRTAFANLDASAVETFWPSVNSRALSRAFDQLDVQKFEFDRCSTDIKAATAITTCSGRARYTPRVGNRTPRVEPRRWTFTLEKANGVWLIRRVESAREGV